MTDLKPSEKILSSSLNGVVITDSLGRKIKLRQPDLLDEYDLRKALGAEEASNEACVNIATQILYISEIENIPLHIPRTNGEVRASLKRIKQEGLSALINYLIESTDLTKRQGGIEEVKK